MGRHRRAGLSPFPGALTLLGWSLVARLHVASTTIAMTLLISGWGRSYAWVGLVLAGLTVGKGVAGPLNGLLVDRLAPPVTLAVTGSLYAVGLAALSRLPVGWQELTPAFALLVGLANPPVGQAARRTWSQLCDEARLERMYRMEAAGLELPFVLAPVLVAFVGTRYGGPAAVLMVALLVLVGGLGFAARLGRLPAGPAATRTATLAGAQRPALALAAVTAATGCTAAAISSVDLALVAWASDSRDATLAGWLIASWAAGSLLGGLVSVVRAAWLRPGPVRRLLWMAGGIAIVVPTLPPAGAGSPVVICAALVVGGLSIAPALAAMHDTVARVSPARSRGTAFGWQAAGVTLGASAGAPATGWLYDAAGPGVATLLAATLCVAAAAIILPVVRTRRGVSTSKEL